ncbi:DUF1842 domain-containing protein [Paraburkholderia madseniana]|jgi:hypothetical protein|uniref:DUF1842 domain-containing protein n=1 Tax=Paraburkholderia madseniana TaxID=2599607 RepID=UPI0015C53B31|nr:DUF1842 domain-containing protein [Paraburkholderia madseniana]NPT69416.1 DUF1842 domain-containing protein [Paraburkholderia madseniana]
MTVGLFPVNFRVATPAIGAPVLTLALLVNTPAKRVSGVARIYQSTYPPLEFHADVWGNFSQIQLAPGSEPNIVLSLSGNPSGPASGLAETFQFHSILKGDWRSGQASYKYLEGGYWHDIEHAIVTLTSALQPHEPSQPVTPLYGVGLQQAKASGDLSRMKSLARQAEQQLADADNIKSELAKLTAEIARLEAHR